jgi:hypothetical protein
MLQNLMLVGELREAQVAHVMAALAVASCHLPIRVVDFQTTKPRSEFDARIAGPLLSFFEKVTVHEEVVCCCASRSQYPYLTSNQLEWR